MRTQLPHTLRRPNHASNPKNGSRSSRHNKTRKMQIQFTAGDFNSGDGMMTATWGPALWHCLHVISFNYPVNPTTEDKRHYKKFITNLRYILPCKYCRINLAKNLKQLPLTASAMSSRDSFSRYIFDLHELVNTMLHKKSSLTFDDVKNKYEQFRSRCNSINKKKPAIASQVPHRRGTRKKKESGCIDPMNGKKTKCVIKIVPA